MTLFSSNVSIYDVLCLFFLLFGFLMICFLLSFFLLFFFLFSSFFFFLFLSFSDFTTSSEWRYTWSIALPVGLFAVQAVEANQGVVHAHVRAARLRPFLHPHPGHVQQRLGVGRTVCWQGTQLTYPLLGPEFHVLATPSVVAVVPVWVWGVSHSSLRVLTLPVTAKRHRPWSVAGP